MMASEPFLLPVGTRLLHIGPHKTGTSSLQSAFHLARRQLHAYGVHYAGRNRQPLNAAQAAAALPGTLPRPRVARSWRALVREVRGSRAARVVISSEWFSDAGDAATRIIAEELDPSRLHVVLTLRPLANIIPSQWQQYVQAGSTVAFEPWLEAVLRRPGTVTPSFWHRHRHDEIAARWAAVVGPERVTVVVAIGHDRGAIPRAFERLVGLPPGLLVPDDDRANRSLTWAEIELIRATNAGLDGAGLDARLKQALVLFGAAARLKARLPARHEPRIRTPDWAYQPILDAARSIVDGLRRSGVRVVGDLEELAAPPGSVTRRIANPAAAPPWPHLAALAAMGILIEAGLARDPSRRPESRRPADATLAAIATVRLRTAFASRVRRSAVGWLPSRRRSRRDLGPSSPIHSSPEVE